MPATGKTYKVDAHQLLFRFGKGRRERAISLISQQHRVADIVFYPNDYEPLPDPVIPPDMSHADLALRESDFAVVLDMIRKNTALYFDIDMMGSICHLSTDAVELGLGEGVYQSPPR